MVFLPLSLGVGRDAKGTVLADRPASRSQVEDVLRRDGHACRCCGFTAKRYQRVLPAALFGEAGGGEDFVTVCSFCEMTAQLDRASALGGGLLIWLPELSQTELHHIVRALYVARAAGGALADAASRTLEVLTSRRAEAKKRVGTDDPLILATALLEELDEAAYAGRIAKMEGLRFLAPDRYVVRQRQGDVNIFPQMIAYWTSPEGPFGKCPVAEWAALFETVAAKAG